MGLVLPKSYCKSTLSLHLQILEAGDIDGDGEEALELDDELAGAGAAPGLQGADLAVEGAADDAHLTAEHGGGELPGGVILHLGAGVDGSHEGVHLGVADNHRTAVAAAHVAELERVRLGESVVEGFLGRVDEEEVADDGDLLLDALAAAHGDALDHGGEHLEAVFAERLVRGAEGVGALEVAHDEPFHGRRFGRGHVFYSCTDAQFAVIHAVAPLPSHEFRLGVDG